MGNTVDRPQPHDLHQQSLPVLMRSLLVALVTAGSLTVCSPTIASAATACGSVGYTVPHTHDEGHTALNNLTASGVSCSTARAVAKAFLTGHKPPQGWHAMSKTVVSHGNTLGEEIFTRGAARVIGDMAN
jgi:hypothetical protein